MKSWTEAVADEMAEIMAAQNALNRIPKPWSAEVHQAFGLLAVRFEALEHCDSGALDTIDGDLEAL